MTIAQTSKLTMAILKIYQDKSAASFYRQVAAWVQDIFCNFYLLKNQKNAVFSQQPLML